jgi:hypothetical protein
MLHKIIVPFRADAGPPQKDTEEPVAGTSQETGRRYKWLLCENIFKFIEKY